VQVVVFVLCLPKAVDEVVGRDEGSVDADSEALDGILGDKSQFAFLSALGEQVSEGAADGTLVVEMKLAMLVEGFVVGLDGGVVRLEAQRHRGRGSLQRIGCVS